MNQAAELMLEFIIVERLAFADEERKCRRQSLATLHQQHEGCDQIIKMQKRLTMGDVTGEDVTHELPFVDPLDLMRQGNRVALAV